MGLWNDFSKGLDELSRHYKQQAMIEGIKDATIEAIEASQGRHRYSSFKLDYYLPVQFNSKNIQIIFDYLKEVYVTPESWELVTDKSTKITFVAGGFWKGYNNFVEYRVKEHKNNIFLIKEQEVTPGNYLTEENKKAFENGFYYDIEGIINIFKTKSMKKIEGKINLEIPKEKLPVFFDTLVKLWGSDGKRKIVKKEKPKLVIFEDIKEGEKSHNEIRIKVSKDKIELIDSQKIFGDKAVFTEEFAKIYPDKVKLDVEKIYEKMGVKKKSSRNNEKYCSDCGASVKKSAKFCSECGVKLE